MRVQILEVSLNELRDAVIKKGQAGKLPSIHEKWHFNFDKRLKELTNATAYILTAVDTPTEIEGCMIFQMKDKKVPVMAYLEIAPHNRGKTKKFDYVAGCLIAFAFKQSLIQAKGDYKGMLFFNVKEEKEEDARKLMVNYSNKYNAQQFPNSTMMVIKDEGGDELIAEYLPDV